MQTIGAMLLAGIPLQAKAAADTDQSPWCATAALAGLRWLVPGQPKDLADRLIAMSVTRL